MNDKKLKTLLKKVGQKIVPDENFVIKTGWDLKRMIRLKQEEQPRPALRLFKVSLTFCLAIIILLSSLKAGEVLADTAKPGDFLYPVDRFFEKARLFLTRHPVVKARIKKRIAQERLKELEKISKKGAFPTQEKSINETKKAIEEFRKDVLILQQKKRKMQKDNLDSQEVEILKKEAQQLIKENKIVIEKIEKRIKRPMLKKKLQLKLTP